MVSRYFAGYLLSPKRCFGAAILAVFLWSFGGVSAALAKGSQSEVFLYTMRQTHLLQPLLDKFEKQTGIHVWTAFLGKNLKGRLEIEGQQSRADLVITTNFHTLYDLDQKGLLSSVNDKELKGAIPASLRDKEGRWFPLTQRARMIYAANAHAKLITSYDDLADPRWKGRVCTRPLTHGYNLALVASYYQHHGQEKTKKWLSGIKSNLAQKPSGNDRAQIKSIAAGVCDLSIGNSYYYWLMLENDEQRSWAEQVTPVFPEQDKGGAHVNISGMALLKSAKNTDAALKLMRYMVSTEAQTYYAKVNREFPVRSDIPLSSPLATWSDVVLNSQSVKDSVQFIDEASDLIDLVGLNN